MKVLMWQCRIHVAIDKFINQNFIYTDPVLIDAHKYH